jgi:hypothetical protein
MPLVRSVARATQRCRQVVNRGNFGLTDFSFSDHTASPAMDRPC